MADLNTLQQLLRESAPKGSFKPIFFKIGSGQYAEHDQFIGVPVPVLKKLAKSGADLSLDEIAVMLKSPINEERQLALFLLMERYRKNEAQEDVYNFFMIHLRYVNNWNLVDSAAPSIVGAHLFERDKGVLLTLAKSEVLWERRIAIVATYYFIRQGSLEWTLKIAEILLQDTQDLIHKAVGWMLRELGKRDQALLETFLDRYGAKMPRTMLRYAIERLPSEQRVTYLTSTRRLQAS